MGIYVGNKRYAPYIGDKRRRYMGGGSSLPYDAEVEYLEGGGTSYFNIPVDIPSGSNFAIGGELRPIKYSGRNFNIGSNTLGIYKFGDAGTMRYVTYVNKIADSNNPLRLPLEEIGTYELSNEGITSNGTFTALERALTSNVTNIKLGVAGTTGYGRFYVKVEGVITVDCTPVRIGNVGYMYDKVNNTLIANGGSTPFILGLDKT